MNGKKRILWILAAVLLFTSACGGQNAAPAATAEPAVTPAPAATPEPMRFLVVYFSRAGEQYNVGVVEKGNTAKLAEVIAGKLGADLFEITPARDTYPDTYEELKEAAQKEKEEKARPAIAGTLPDPADYDVIFIGSPVWHGDWPMILYTYFEGADLEGKTLVPFCTHGGGGLQELDKKLARACPYSTVLEGLAIKGEDAQAEVQLVDLTVSRWLERLGYLPGK